MPQIELETVNGMDVRTVLREAMQTISSFSSDHPERQAEILAQAVLNVERAKLYTNDSVRFTTEQIQRLNQFIHRRRQGEPIQYIIGTVEFRHLTLKADPRALIPRPETEGLVEIGLDLIRSTPEPVILDIGTGCGAIALSFTAEHSGARCTGIDISRDALDLAEENSRKTGLSDRILWKWGDLFHNDFFSRMDIRYDLIVSNPPYIETTEADSLPPEVREWEPDIALYSGVDGLEAIKRLSIICHDHLKDGCYFICEIGEGQEKAIIDIYRKAGWDIHVKNDLSGITRYLIAK